jgi:hypothetical protein
MTNKEKEEFKAALKHLYGAVSDMSGNSAPAKSTLDSLSLAANMLRKIERELDNKSPSTQTKGKIEPMKINTSPSATEEYLKQQQRMQIPTPLYNGPYWQVEQTTTVPSTTFWYLTPDTTIKK